jgi:hypothetical protein
VLLAQELYASCNVVTVGCAIKYKVNPAFKIYKISYYVYNNMYFVLLRLKNLKR